MVIQDSLQPGSTPIPAWEAALARNNPGPGALPPAAERILLLNLPFERPVQRDYGCPHGVKASYYWPPIDLLLFGAIVRETWTLSYLDCIAGGYKGPRALEMIRRLNPGAIFTILSSITLERDLAFIAEVRAGLPGVKVWAGGDVIYFGGERYEGIDFYVRDLTNAERIRELRATAGGTVERQVSAEFSVGVCPHELTLGYPYSMPYSLYPGIASVLTNYGCPFDCTFCNSNQFGFKRRELGEVLAELEYIESLGIREVIFRDFTFNMSDAERLCGEILRRGIRLRWSCWTSPALVNMRILDKMRAAGCYLIAYGAESGDDLILRRVRKASDTSSVQGAVRMTREAGIEALTSFIVGFPDEDPGKTARLIRAIDPDYIAVNILVPRVGSRLGDNSTAGAKDTDSLTGGSDVDRRRRDLLERSFYTSPRRLLRYLWLSLKSRHRLFIFLKNALGMLRRWLLSG